MQRGLLIVLSGPSGVGKGTVCSSLRKQNKEIIYSVSSTSRKPRPNEIEGVNYFFKEREEFEDMIRNDTLLEWTEYCGNYYGTSLSFVEENIKSGKDIILEIEVQGAVKVKKKYSEGIFIFLIPPSFSELKNRIEYRGTENEKDIYGRMNVAKEEFQMIEHYDYVIINDKLQEAVNGISSIIEAEKLKRERILPYFKTMLKEELF